jgi:hypothetical protein
MKNRGWRVSACLVVWVLPATADAVTVNLVSDTSWEVTDASGSTPLGQAQNVCLLAASGATPASPANCPPGATLYGGNPTWTADLSTIPGATWIWAPNITAASTPASNQTYRFRKEFYLCDAPKDGTISVAVDNDAKVFVNGEPAPILTTSAFSHLASATVPASMLTQGRNSITISGTNIVGCADNKYACNPAGVVFGGAFADALSSWPTCTDGTLAFNVGKTQFHSCPSGQIGTQSRTCDCVNGNGAWSGWTKTCTTVCVDNNTAFSVGQPETVPCPPGRSGSQTRVCKSDGSWGPFDVSKCVAATTTCFSNGRTFAVGEKDSVACPAGKLGFAARTCQGNGSWSAIDSSTCSLPPVGPDNICGSSSRGLTATCPSGKTCASCRTSKDLVTADWFCDCVGAALGQPCNNNYNCASGSCDRGDGTSKTGLCMPRAGTGKLAELCSNNNQCVTGRCQGLFQDVSSTWHPGRCGGNTKSGLGEPCATNADCASAYCDRGDGTSKTSLCMPNGNGRTGDTCSHPNQCSSRACAGLHAQGNAWIPGRCQ